MLHYDHIAISARHWLLDVKHVGVTRQNHSRPSPRWQEPASKADQWSCVQVTMISTYPKQSINNGANASLIAPTN